MPRMEPKKLTLRVARFEKRMGSWQAKGLRDIRKCRGKLKRLVAACEDRLRAPAEQRKHRHRFEEELGAAASEMREP